MWTVTLLLKPVVVTLHLLGGMSTLALLLSLYLRQNQQFSSPTASVTMGIRWLAACSLAAVLAQIALGGWVSSNYAALACTAFPHCLDGSSAEFDFRHAFTLTRELGQTIDGQALPTEALMTIHWLHRLGALVVTVLTISLAVRLIRFGALRSWGLGLLGILGLQLALGITNVLAALPIAIAVAHTLGAALLLSTLLAVNLRLDVAQNYSKVSNRRLPHASAAHTTRSIRSA
jgi:cytochrome c oxidase assembly protein subunit 15